MSDRISRIEQQIQVSEEQINRAKELMDLLKKDNERIVSILGRIRKSEYSYSREEKDEAYSILVENTNDQKIAELLIENCKMSKELLKHGLVIENLIHEIINIYHKMDKLNEELKYLVTSHTIPYTLLNEVMAMRNKGMIDKQIAYRLYDKGQGLSKSQIGALLYTGNQKLPASKTLQEKGTELLSCSPDSAPDSDRIVTG